jgi:chitinase
MLLSISIIKVVFFFLFINQGLSTEAAEKKFIAALYYSDWSHAKQLPSEIPLSRITNIYYAFASIDVKNLNIKFENIEFALNKVISFKDDTLLEDCSNLTVNAANYKSIPWIDKYLKNVQENVASNQKEGISNGIIDQLRKMREINPRLKISLSLGGAKTKNDFSKITSNKKQIKQFVANLVANVNGLGFDGIDIDWEFPGSSRDSYALDFLIKSLRTLLDKGSKSSQNTKIISLAIPLDKDVLKNYNFPELNKYVDYFNLMGYDIAGTWSDFSGFHSQLYTDTNLHVSPTSVDDSIKYLSGMLDKAKIILGLPTYGISFNTDKLYTKFDGCAKIQINAQNEDDEEDYQEECIIDYIDLPPAGYHEVENLEIGASYAYDNNSDNKGLIVYDTPRISRLKARYVFEQGLGGGLWWDSKGDTLIKNTSRSLVYNFIDELGGISQLACNISDIASYGVLSNSVISTHVTDGDFKSSTTGKASLSKLLILSAIISCYFILLI